jgi:hypothetical protein
MEFNNEIQTKHFDNSSALSIEGSSVQIFDRSSLAANAQNIITVEGLVRTRETCAHFLDGKRQDAQTTFESKYACSSRLFIQRRYNQGG